MKTWRYTPFRNVHQTWLEGLDVFPREPDLTVSAIRLVWAFFFRLFLRVYFRPTIHGHKLGRPDKSQILIANHASHLDAIMLTFLLPLRNIDHVFSVAAKDYFFSSFCRRLISAVFINALPFDRKENKRQSLEDCADALAISKHRLIIFPEGTRSPDGQIQMFKKGIGILAAGRDVDVIPVFIEGAHRAWPKGKGIPRPYRIHLHVGDPMNFSDEKRDEQAYVDIASALEAQVRALENQTKKDG